MSYIRFIPETSKGKTCIWSVRATKDFMTLGLIKWFGHWWGYAYFPDKDTVYAPDCLKEIAEFCEDKTREFKEAVIMKKKEDKKCQAK